MKATTPLGVSAPLAPPTPLEVRAARATAGVTQEAASALIYQFSSANWRAYEAGRIKIHPSSWELFLLKTGQHPTLQLTQRQVSDPH